MQPEKKLTQSLKVMLTVMSLTALLILCNPVSGKAQAKLQLRSSALPGGESSANSTSTSGSAPDSSSFSKTVTFKIKTGTESGAGTDANIWLYADTTASFIGWIRLNSHVSGNAFENGQEDIAPIFLKGGPGAKLGDINHVCVYNDGKFAGAAWLLEWISIDGQQCFFNEWIPGRKVHISNFCMRNGVKIETPQSVRCPLTMGDM